MYTHTAPPTPTLAITALATVCPAPSTFTFDANGNADPHGNTVTYPPPCGPTTVTFNTTAAAPTGTPARPATATAVTDPAARTPIPANCPSTVPDPGRESNTRAGDMGT